MHRFLWLLCLLCTSLLADEAPEGDQCRVDHIVPQPEPTSLVNMTGMPSSFVNGSVNTISGDFFESREDYSVSGPDPYALGHTYSSSGLEEGTLGAGWNFYHHHYLRVYQPKGINFARAKSLDLESSEPSDSVDNELSFSSEFLVPKGVQKNAGGYKVHGKPPNSKKNPYTYLYLREPSGGDFLFKGDGWGKNFQLVKKNTGFTNVSGDLISGQTNIKNIKIKWFSESDHWHVVFGDGTRRVYGRMKKSKDKKLKDYFYDYHLLREVRPSRNTLVFNYDDNDKLKLIETFSHDRSQKHNWIRFEHKEHLHISTSDNQNFTFEYKKLEKKNKVVSCIKRPEASPIRFSYSGKRVSKRSTDDGHFIETEYYDKKAGDFAKKRVKSQSAPVGKDGKKVITHQFSYHERKKKENTHYATVKDAHGTITRYHWNRFKRLVKIVKYSSSWKPLMTERFVWGKTHHTGHLKVRTLFDEHDTPLLSRQFSYDNRGNVIREVLYGRFTENAGAIKLDGFGYPTESTCDKIVTERVYSKDGYNLLLEEKDCFGNYTFYNYKPLSNRLQAKFTCDQQEIKKREFFSYDTSSCLTQYTVDDGSKREKENLDDVTERHITKIKPRNTFPHFGKPEVIDQYYFDLNTKEECLLTQTVNHYSNQGFLKEQQVYTGKGQLHATSHYDHDAVGRVTYTENPLGQKEFLKYDQFGRLTERQGPRDDITIYYDYDVCSRLIKQTEVQKNGPSFTTSYEYDLLGRKVAVISPQGHRTKISYDELNRITEIAKSAIYDHQGKESIPTQKFEYSKLGTEVLHTDENGFKTKTIFNAIGKVISQKLPDGTTTENFYDLKSNCIKEVAPNGVIQHIKYDAFNRPTSLTVQKGDKKLSEKTMSYNTFHLLSESGPTNEIVEYAYDAAGRKQTLKQNKRETTYCYNEIGLLHTETSHGITKEFTYDLLGRPILESVKDSSGKQFSYTIYGYDVDGNCSETIRSIMDEPAVSYTTYDPHKRVIKEVDAKGNSWNYTYDDFATNSYHQTVTKKTSYDPTGVYSEELFDSHGRLSRFTSYDPFGMLLSEKELFYDVAGNCLRTCEHSIVNGVKQKAIITLLFYGPNNRLEGVTEAYNTPEEKTTRYSYNSFGQKEQTLHSNEVALQYSYDHRGRLKRLLGSSVDYRYKYDASDRITRVFNAITQQETLRTYDDIGNITSETLESGLTMEYSHDELGRVREMTLPDQSKIAYSYSPVFLQSIKRLDANSEEKWQHQILKRDLSGNILSTQLPKEAGKTSFAYDLLNRQIKSTHDAFTEELVEFDPAGNLLALSFTDATGFQHNTYRYNNLYQLTEETGHTPRQYDYDSLHNRIDHQVNSLHSVLHDGNRSFAYDARGNRIQMEDTTYQYDALDRLIEVSTPYKKTTYSYDAFDRRLEKKQYAFQKSDWELENYERYLYALQNEIGCVDVSDTIFQLRVLGEGLGAEIGAAVAIELDNVLHIPLHDHRGNIVALVCPEGTVVESYRYDAYGNEEKFSTVDARNPWRFSSKRVDEETNFIYFGRRYYDPSIGKWLTQDPLGLNAGPNLYAYALNNPMMSFDLYGLLEESVSRSGCYTSSPGTWRDVSDRQGGASPHEIMGRDLPAQRPSPPPEIRHNHRFEKFFDDNPSKCYDLLDKGRPNLPFGLGMGWINGIMNSFTDTQGSAQYISDLGGGYNVFGTYNATHGLFLDLYECSLGLGHVSTEPVRLLQKTWRDFFENSPAGSKYLQICQSQGVIHTRNGLQDFPKELRERILVVAIAPAAYIDPKTCGGVYHYRAANPLRDIVPRIDRAGAAKAKGTIVDLKSHPDAPLWDHSFQSPTYQEILKKHITNYIKSGGQSL